MNVRTYQAYDINGYTFYTEKKDHSTNTRTWGVTMLSYADEESTVNERFFRRIEEIWELKEDADVLGQMGQEHRKRRPVLHHHGHTRSQIQCEHPGKK
jgi:hypothetical protein